ncbi:MSMEG_4193 family putative phosphomutase [Nocardia otitidiscaviarum]|uniref:Phosphoglyceromutase n=1 Tax=Nocardia otitidiscaviarum TaxID=1823 RepID=A0A379JJP5_9NOCA|nr:histidine phosphatase family protein [Nocardia otitidiscaviarum]MBF6136440.1 MSMEG_4193 family putative phosphomutase [Nocardia otitidiscaviarum]MBF6484642.1 MSMEG_4193 family putative phosphomutase [Nocardia otitidiscaviarum]SUD48660.1 Phosphoglyceromutase [Nocardia otitidiscaviarum]
MTVILLRHGVSTSNAAHTLAGRSAGVDLTDRGREQAQALVQRLGSLPIEHIVCSPLLRCQRTVAPLADKLGIEPEPDERLLEVDYGDWTGRPLGELLSEPLWKVVQRHASAAAFPSGEGLAQVQFRAVSALREHDAALARKHGGDALWVACTHGDVIKSVLADAYGMHLDLFQRIVVEPASISVVRYTPTAPYVWRVNDTGTDLSTLAAVSPRRGDAAATGPVPGGETGNTASTDNGDAERPDSHAE